MAGVSGWHAASGKLIRAATILAKASAVLRLVSGDEMRHTVYPLAKNSAAAPENMRGDISQELCLSCHHSQRRSTTGTPRSMQYS